MDFIVTFISPVAGDEGGRTGARRDVTEGRVDVKDNAAAETDPYSYVGNVVRKY